MPADRHRFGRPDPDALLARVQAAERAERRGQLKIFLGYAPGVGKSFRLFDEGRRRRNRGEDVIIAATQPKNDPQVEETCPRTRNDPDTRHCRRAGHRRRCGAHAPPSGLHRRWTGVRQPTRKPSSEAISGCGGAVGCRHLRTDVAEHRLTSRNSRTSSKASPAAASATQCLSCSSSKPAKWSSSMRRPTRPRPGMPINSRSCASVRCSWPPTWSTGSSSRTCASRHPVHLGHAGAYSRVHDPASQRSCHAGQRQPECRPLSR